MRAATSQRQVHSRRPDSEKSGSAPLPRPSDRGRGDCPAYAALVFRRRPRSGPAGAHRALRAPARARGVHGPANPSGAGPCPRLVARGPPLFARAARRPLRLRRSARRSRACGRSPVSPRGNGREHDPERKRLWSARARTPGRTLGSRRKRRCEGPGVGTRGPVENLVQNGEVPFPFRRPGAGCPGADARINPRQEPSGESERRAG